MAKNLCKIALSIFLLQLLTINIRASSILAGDANSLNVNSIGLRIRNELKNAELEAEIGRVTMENRIKQSKNTIMMHIQEIKTHLKASKSFLKPNGMYINPCIVNVTNELGKITFASLNQCTTGLVSMNNHLNELKMLEIETRKIIFNCHLTAPTDIDSCVQGSTEEIRKRMEGIAQAVRDEVDKIRIDTCTKKVENLIYDELSNLLLDFADCLQTELVE